MPLPPILERGSSAHMSSALSPAHELSVEDRNVAPSDGGSGVVGAVGGGVDGGAFDRGIGGGVALRRRTKCLRCLGRWLLPRCCRPECFDVQVKEGPSRRLDSLFDRQQEERKEDANNGRQA